MERIKELNGYQKGILVVVTAMLLVFSILYGVVTSRVGYSYKGALLMPSQEGENTVYTGKLYGVETRLTVTAEKTVELQYGEESFGPYSIRVASSAVPEGMDTSGNVTGLELLRGDEVLFRGAVVDLGDSHLLYHQDGSIAGVEGSYEDSYGGEAIEPSVSNVLDLLDGPELIHRGDWTAWLGGVFCCVVTALSILFVDELFRFQLSFSIRNVEDAEPSEWEIMGRYIAWTVLPIAALAVFIMGLQ